MTDSRRLAVLIDADNVSSKVSTDLFAHNDSALNADTALTTEPQTHVGF